MPDLPLTKLSETASTITLGWTPPAGAQGYLFFAGARRSSTLDGSRSSVRFSKGTGPYRVQALGVIAEGTYPAVVPPAPPTGRVDLSSKATTIDAMFTYLASHNVPSFIPARTYKSTGVLYVPAGADLELRGVTIDTTNPNGSAVYVKGDRTKLSFTGVCRIGRQGQRYARQPEGWKGGLVFDAATNFQVFADDLTIEGVANIGVLCFGGCGPGTIAGRIAAVGTGADSFHTSSGCHDIDWTAALTSVDSGDDGAAIVSQVGALVQRVHYRNVTVRAQRWGRGVAIVGGKDCSIVADVDGSAGAGVYVAQEAGWGTESVDQCQVVAKVRNPCRNSQIGHHGNALVWADAPTSHIKDVVLTIDADPAFPTAVNAGGRGQVVNVTANGKAV